MVGVETSTIGSRLRSERLRLGVSQSALAEACGAKKTSQINYEAGRTYPDADYLVKAAAVGVDVLYVLTGERAPISPEPGAAFSAALTGEEAALVDNFRHSSAEGRCAIAAAGAALAQHAALKKAG